VEVTVNEKTVIMVTIHAQSYSEHLWQVTCHLNCFRLYLKQFPTSKTVQHHSHIGANKLFAHPVLEINAIGKMLSLSMP